MINFVDAGRNKNVTRIGQLVQDLGSKLSFCTVTIFFNDPGGYVCIFLDLLIRPSSL